MNGATPTTTVQLANHTDWRTLLSSGLELLRRTHGLTQRELADASGLNVDTIGRIERGLVRTYVQPATLCAIAAACGYDTLTQLWEALQNAKHHQSIHHGHTITVDDRTQRLVAAFQELTPLQQQMAEAIVSNMLARVRAHRSGEEALCVIEPVPLPPRRRR